MNETDWLGGGDASSMLDYIAGQASDRKLRLFACACVRLYWRCLRYDQPKQVVELAERVAEGLADEAELEPVREQSEMWVYDAPWFEQPTWQAVAATTAELAAEAARTALDLIRQQAVREASNEAAPGEDEAALIAAESERVGRAQADLLRELFGNPFRPAKIDPTWLKVSSGAAGAIARLIDEERHFEEMPYLADALTDAGCDDETLLRHLRSPAGHVRGCWALDALLGRS